MFGYDVNTKCPDCGDVIDMHFDMSEPLTAKEVDALIEMAKILHRRNACPGKV